MRSILWLLGVRRCRKRKRVSVVIRYRSFRNTDPPKLVEIWRSADPQTLAQSMSVSLLEDLVLGKPYFDRCGLIVACEEKNPVGFGHAGFGPSADRGRIWST